ncbi:hypothetical protein GGQ67_005072 [Rhizobium metallidurans]|uniref:Uncharacterized protein n=1 Tax=Rhizobium metallidurans TaxID=1265931 RepID=A0A7W6CYU9_9HYPH|nr:hypothetical protein [Rhizobium metallidurans]
MNTVTQARGRSVRPQMTTSLTNAVVGYQALLDEYATTPSPRRRRRQHVQFGHSRIAILETLKFWEVS